MKSLKTLLPVALTLLYVWSMSRGWETGTIRIPPPGKFLDPFHGLWQNIEGTKTHLPATLQRAVQRPVTIVWDSLLIPHIFAANEHDLYFSQGYITAMHRLWQMEFQTHAAAGRLSEILGPGKDDAVLNYDRQQRRLGMVFAAENALKGMEKIRLRNRSSHPTHKALMPTSHPCITATFRLSTNYWIMNRNPGPT